MRLEEDRVVDKSKRRRHIGRQIWKRDSGIERQQRPLDGGGIVQVSREIELHDDLIAGLTADGERASKLDGARTGRRHRMEARIVCAQQLRLRSGEGRRERKLAARLAVAQRRETEPAILAGQQHEIRLPVAIDVLGILTEYPAPPEERSSTGNREVLQRD